MTNKKAPIQWTPKQIEVAQLLQQGALNKDIAKQLGIAPSLVTKVSKVLKKGFLPPDISYEANELTVQVQAATTPPEDKTGTGVTPTTPSKPELDVATLAKLTPQVAYIQLTPIMIAAKYYLVRELGWSADAKWEDIIDTIFYKYFKGAYRILLQAYTKMEEEKKELPKPAGGNGNKANNGSNQLKVDIDSPEFQELCTVVTKQIAELIQAGKLG